ncbi:hypothetical protein [Candidatus Similichlamydia epinepheli]|uniref:hypothetical protein n=1 Tax=Candidatus Similichlamydia epinepheli TaxID=1903953 RepID=UPI000D373972|nr:hypothetical protein [Candidatus Similichlamydia epinepheli]
MTTGDITASVTIGPMSSTGGSGRRPPGGGGGRRGPGGWPPPGYSLSVSTPQEGCFIRCLMRIMFFAVLFLGLFSAAYSTPNAIRWYQNCTPTGNSAQSSDSLSCLGGLMLWIGLILFTSLDCFVSANNIGRRGATSWTSSGTSFQFIMLMASLIVITLGMMWGFVQNIGLSLDNGSFGTFFLAFLALMILVATSVYRRMRPGPHDAQARVESALRNLSRLVTRGQFTRYLAALTAASAQQEGAETRVQVTVSGNGQPPQQGTNDGSGEGDNSESEEELD